MKTYWERRRESYTDTPLFVKKEEKKKKKSKKQK
ncbi:MAG: hypothetical protein KatS3mg096_718 [Candidatus Parcubacteria bacterium]|nr:MAG: hypothetical protein KatS3mg096_690 [Candidatus Parcubacteria bacterium]GIW67850.1 MAG: hypothetical protein KatS3mg096_718 [Candidatus Parcubacteria bacterium]